MHVLRTSSEAQGWTEAQSTVSWVLHMGVAAQRLPLTEPGVLSHICAPFIQPAPPLRTQQHSTPAVLAKPPKSLPLLYSPGNSQGSGCLSRATAAVLAAASGPVQQV